MVAGGGGTTVVVGAGGWSYCRTSCRRWGRSGLGHVRPGNFVRVGTVVGERDSASGGEGILLAALVPAA